VVFINYSTKEISVKIVYYGPGLSGKTTNLQYIYKKTDKSFRGELVSLDTDTERTLFFDLLPMEVGKIRGFTTKIQLYTVPGQVHYNTTRKLVLKGVDGIVFVVDSQAPILEANLQNYKNMLENLEFNKILIDKIPLVFQYNKRDLNNIIPVGELNMLLNPSNKTFFEAVAIKGKGVLETLREITRLTLHSVKEEVFGDFPQESAENIDKKNKKGKEIGKEEKEITPETGEETEEIEVVDEKTEEEPSEEETIIDIEKKTKKEETETKAEEVKEEKEPLIESKKNLIEKNLSLKIPSEKIIDSSHIYIQFTNQEGDLIKKWKISKNKIINGATLSLKVDIDIK